MFRISLKIQQARSRRDPDKPGKVYIKIIERTPMDGGPVRSLSRTVNTGIPVPAGLCIQDLQEEAVPYIYNTYLVIDQFYKSGSAFTVDDVCRRLRTVIASEKFTPFVSDDFVWNAEVSTLKKELIPLFRYKKRYSRRGGCDGADVGAESLLGFLYSMSQRMLSEGRESTSNSYISTMLSLKHFLGDKNISLSDVDHTLIESYAGWLKKTGVADSTLSFYLRTLRSGINYAVNEGLAEPDKDLFRNVYTKIRRDSTAGEPIYLSRESLQKIAGLDLSDSPKLDLARDMFMFGFYCRGMELTDIINLRTENLRDNKLTFRRRGIGREITLRLDPQAMAILKKYENRRIYFLFPLKSSPLMKLDKALKYQVTTWLDAVGKKVGLHPLMFSMNISTWNYLMSQVNIASALLGT